MNHQVPNAGPTALTRSEQALLRRLAADPTAELVARRPVHARRTQRPGATVFAAGRVVGGVALVAAAVTLPGVLGRLLQLGALGVAVGWWIRFADRVSRP